MTAAAALLSIVAALLPAILKWLERLGSRDLPTRSRHERELEDLASALERGDAVDVAAVFAERDRLLQLDGRG